jgi:hypothetical protein
MGNIAHRLNVHEVASMYKGKVDINNTPRDEWERRMFQWVHSILGRQILTKWLLDGLSYEQIAEDLNVSRSTVYKNAKVWSEQLFSHCD